MYSLEKLLPIMGGFLSLGFLYLLTYKNILIRYALTATLVFAAWIKRREIIHAANEMLFIRKNNKNQSQAKRF